MSPETLLAHLHAALRAKPPEGVSVTYLDGFFSRNRSALLAMLGELRPSRPSGLPTRWGGARAETPLTPDEITLGRHVVDEEGHHGKVVKVWLRPGFFGGPPFADGDLTLDSGRTARLPFHLYAELAPPVRVPRDPVFGGEAISPSALWRIVASALSTALSAEELLDDTPSAANQARRRAVRDQLVRFATAHDLWLQWRAEHPDTPVDGFTGLVARQAELERRARRGEASPEEIAERAALRTLSPQWRTLQVGEGVARVRLGLHGKQMEPGWRLVALDGEAAQVQLGDRVESAPLWLLQPAPFPAETIELPKTPTYIIDLYALLTRHAGDGAPYPDRALISGAVKRYLADEGLSVSVRVERGSGITSISLRPTSGLHWTPEAKQTLHKLLPGASVWDNAAHVEPWERDRRESSPYDDYGGKLGGVALPADKLLPFARLLVPAIVKDGGVLSPLGEAIRLSLAPKVVQRGPARVAPTSAAPSSSPSAGASVEGCVEITFSLPGHGEIRVVCGAQGRREVWYNIYVGRARFGFNGGRWAKGQRPPQAVLDAVRARGITAFDGP